MEHKQYNVVFELTLDDQVVILMNTRHAMNQNQAVWLSRRDLYHAFNGLVAKDRFVLQCITDASGSLVMPTVN